MKEQSQMHWDRSQLKWHDTMPVELILSERCGVLSPTLIEK
jgi:hypothetical protein